MIGSVQRALDILELYTPGVSELGITEIAQAMGSPKSTAAGLTATLEINGYLEQNPQNRKYRLGFKLAERAGVLLEQFDIRQVAAPVLETLREKCQEGINLAILDQGDVVYIARLHGYNLLGMRSEIGKRERAHSTALGKAMLASIPETEFESYLAENKFTPQTPHTITSKTAFANEIHNTRQRGFAIDDQENELGGRCVAAPVFDYQGQPIAAVSISVPVQTHARFAGRNLWSADPGRGQGYFTPPGRYSGVFMTGSHYDVIIVGGGGSGLAAAVSAAEHGAEVLLLEKQSELGGATGIAVGSLTANSTPMQVKAGIEDSLDAHAEDAGKFASPEIEAANNNELRRWFLSHSADTLTWLQDMGLQFFGPNPELPNRVPRMHNVVPGAKAYITALHARLTRLGGEVLTQAPVVDLVKNNDRITGVIAEINGEESPFNARRGVVLAAGDYANAPALIARFKGDRFAEIEGIYDRANGDGHILAERAGAQLVNMEITYGPELRFIPPKTKTFQQLLPTSGPLSRLMGTLIPVMPQFLMIMMIRRLLVTWQHPEDSLFVDGAILINVNGNRFCDERLSPEREIAIARQPDKSAYILLDQKLIERYGAWPNFISTAPKIGYAYAKDYLKLRPDIAVWGTSLTEVCAKRNLPVGAVQNAISDNNAGKSENNFPTLNKAPWLLLGPAKAYFTTTEGGAAINNTFQALDKNGIPIPGLYAIGQNGLGGQILWGHGLHICWAMTSGRLVGKQLASVR